MMKPPALWGYDPKLRYEFVPSSVSGVEDPPTFVLRTPNVRVADAIDAHLSKTSREAMKRAPEAFEVIRKYAEKKQTDLSPDELKEFLSAQEAMDRAYESSDFEDELYDVMAKTLAFCVVSWKNFKTYAGEDIEFPSDKREIIDCLQPTLVRELFTQCKRGAILNKEEASHLK